MVKWKQRGARILGSFVTGYSGGLGVTLPLTALSGGIVLGGFEIFGYPIISGFLASLPQLGKVLNEISDMSE